MAHARDRHYPLQPGVCDRPRRVLGAEQRDANHLVDPGLRVGRYLRGRHAGTRARR